MAKATFLRRLELSELSFVDRPANKAARITIFKRAEPGSNQGDENMPKTVQELEKALETASAELETAKADAAKSAELQKQIDEMTTANKALEAEKAEALAKAGMTDEEKEHYRKLPKEKQGEFAAMSSADRKKHMKKAEEGDEVVKIAGRDIRKSEVGETAFEIFKSQAAELAKQSKDLAEERDRRVTAELTKRAEAEYPKLPGEVAKKVSVLKAMDAMDEETRGTLATMLKAGEDAIAKGFEKLGHKDGKGTNGAGGTVEKAAFDKRVSEIQKRDNSTRNEAMQKARTEHPDEFKAFQEAA